MLTSSGSATPQQSPVTPQSSHGHRRSDEVSTRRLAHAIDALRRQSEAVLWELNSLKTQNSVLEQRMLGQADELSAISRSLIALREQHKLMEQQYKEKLISLRSELRALQQEQTSGSLPTIASTSARGRDHSPSSPDRPLGVREQSGLSLSISRFPPMSTSAAPTASMPVIPANSRHVRDVDKETDEARIMRHRMRSAMAAESSYTPPLLSRNPSSYSPLHQSPYLSQHHSPRGDPGSIREPSHGFHSQNVATSPTRHDPSLSPTATLVGSDAPSKPRSRKGQT